jgi:hypothetical protein
MVSTMIQGSACGEIATPDDLGYPDAHRVGTTTRNIVHPARLVGEQLALGQELPKKSVENNRMLP